VGGIPAIITDGKTGLLCPPHDADALASGILKLLDNTALKDSIAQMARSQVRERFSLGLMAQKTIALYREIIC
jgi:glycosyltransferase involved in cell wall biosynthesis